MKGFLLEKQQPVVTERCSKLPFSFLEFGGKRARGVWWIAARCTLCIGMVVRGVLVGCGPLFVHSVVLSFFGWW